MEDKGIRIRTKHKIFVNKNMNITSWLSILIPFRYVANVAIGS